MQHTRKVVPMFSLTVCADLAIHKPFQVICSLNCHVFISGCVLRALKVFSLTKYVQDLAVNIELSKCRFSGVAQLDFPCIAFQSALHTKP